jgi:hypothetical protein
MIDKIQLECLIQTDFAFKRILIFHEQENPPPFILECKFQDGFSCLSNVMLPICSSPCSAYDIQKGLGPTLPPRHDQPQRPLSARPAVGRIPERTAGYTSP